MKTFKTHGVLPTANCGGYEIQLNDDGQQARVRYNIGYGTTKYRWQLIKYNEEGEPFVTFRGKRLMLGWFMKVN
jgi:hypothetical protein